MNKFEEFNIKSIPHIENSDTDMLANVASNNDSTHDIFSIELICRPLIPDNNQTIFADIQPIMEFLQSKDIFKGW